MRGQVESISSGKIYRRFAATAETHYFPEDRVHYVWDNELDPALTVAPGETVVPRG